MNHNFLVHKKDFFDCDVRSSEIPRTKENEVVFKIESYAFTSNNITYAVVGDSMGYWNFFPTHEPNGIIPVWGFANVVESGHTEIKVGERFYGYWPMAHYLKVQPAHIKSHGLVDGSSHRSKLPPLYNYYARVKGTSSKEENGYYSLIKPLFTTAYLNYRFLQEERFFNASQIVLTSASSKTALGIAYMLFANREDHGKKIIGLTSESNQDFVESTGFYDQVIPYGDVSDKLTDRSTMVIDLSGNTELLQNLTYQLKEQLKFISLIGLADWTSAGPTKQIPKARFFFAPEYAQKLFADLGPEKANKMINEAQEKFTKHVSGWMELEFVDFEKGVKKLYIDMLNGKVHPSKGYIVTIKNE